MSEPTRQIAPPLTGADLLDLLTAAAGPPDASPHDVLDTDFDVLGYDSLARLETAALVQARYGVRMPDDVVTVARTPRELLAVTNQALAGADL